MLRMCDHGLNPGGAPAWQCAVEGHGLQVGADGGAPAAELEVAEGAGVWQAWHEAGAQPVECEAATCARGGRGGGVNDAVGSRCGLRGGGGNWEIAQHHTCGWLCTLLHLPQAMLPGFTVRGCVYVWEGSGSHPHAAPASEEEVGRLMIPIVTAVLPPPSPRATLFKPGHSTMFA